MLGLLLSATVCTGKLGLQGLGVHNFTASLQAAFSVRACSILSQGSQGSIQDPNFGAAWWFAA